MAAGDSGAMATQMLSSSKQLGIRLRRSPPATTAERNDHCVDTQPVHGVDAGSWILASRILHRPYPCPGAAADAGSRRATCVLPVASEPCWVCLRSVSASFQAEALSSGWPHSSVQLWRSLRLATTTTPLRPSCTAG